VRVAVVSLLPLLVCWVVVGMVGVGEGLKEVVGGVAISLSHGVSM